jgi:DNA-binding MarR family transcriptional regulator
MKQYPLLILFMSLSLLTLGVQTGEVAGSGEPCINTEVDICINLTVNSSLPESPIVVHEPEIVNSTTATVHQLKGNLTNLTTTLESERQVTFERDRSGPGELVAGTRTGIASSPSFISTGINLGAGKTREAIPAKARTTAGTGVSVVGSLIGRVSQRAVIRLPGSPRASTTGPAVTPDQFIATTLMGIIIMGMASLLSRKHEFPLMVPLYSRISRDEVLENPTRGDIYQLVARNPGMDLLSIKTDLNLSNGVLAHHIHTLEREKYLRSVRDGRFRRFYVSGVNVAQGSTVERLILKEIEANPLINQSQLAHRMNLSRQAIHYHIQKLVMKGLVSTERQGRQTLCKKRDF